MAAGLYEEEIIQSLCYKSKLELLLDFLYSHLLFSVIPFFVIGVGVLGNREVLKLEPLEETPKS